MPVKKYAPPPQEAQPPGLWAAEAHCDVLKTDPRLWDAPDHPIGMDPPTAAAISRRHNVEIIQAYCKHCPVLMACREWAVKNGQTALVAGGLMPSTIDLIVGGQVAMPPETWLDQGGGRASIPGQPRRKRKKTPPQAVEASAA